jgi:hypothetical protein
MTIYEFLRTDHQTISDLFARLSETASGQVMLRRTLFAKLRHRLLQHAQAEQDVFYAALLEHGVDKELVFDALEDHAAVAFMIGELETLSVSEKRWFDILIDLSETVRRHFQVEEDAIFKEAREQQIEAEPFDWMLGR